MSFKSLEDNIVISVSNVSKQYQIYSSPDDRLKQSILPKVQRAFGLKPKEYCKVFCSLEDISFEVRAGETLGIVGSNGSGKSTLLQIICGTLSPTSGEVNVNGRIAALLELGSGFNPEFTGKENVYLNSAVLGLSKKEIDEKYSSIEEFAEISDFINQPIKTYSSGMVMRLAFSVAIHSNPDILIIDEALAVGDFYFQQKCFQRLSKLKESGTSIIFVSHDAREIVELSDFAIFISEGKLKFKGLPKDVISTYHNSLQKLKVDLPHKDNIIKDNNIKEPINLNTIYDINQNVQDYGTRDIEITDWAIIDEQTGDQISVIPSERKVAIYIKGYFQKDCQDPIYGYFFTDKMGRQIVGANTKYLKSDLGMRKAGEILEVKFTQAFGLPSGEYSLNIGLSEFTKDGHVAHHRLYDLCTFTFILNNTCVGFYHPETQIDIKEVPK